MLDPSAGAGYQAAGAPGAAGIAGANTQVQNSIGQQQSFVNALNAQNGLGNQSAVFNQQQQLANQLQGVANGTGPNPAQAALNQATGANIASQSALMAGQRGSQANAGLMARQAAMQGANTQQQAAGQGATMQAQQQLAAMQQLQGQQTSMANTANTQVNQQQTGVNSLNQNTLQNQANTMGLQSSANSTNAQIAVGNQNSSANILGGLAGAAGAAMMFMADGGEAQALPSQYLSPGTNSSVTPIAAAQTGASGQGSSAGPQSNAAKAMSQSFVGNNSSGLTQGMTQLGSGIGHLLKSTPQANVDGAIDVTDQTAVSPNGVDSSQQPVVSQDISFAKGGKVPALVSPGEIRIHRKDVKKVAEGKKSAMAGEKIKGKPKVGGAVNSYANDTVPKELNEGDIIIPRSITQGKNPQWAAHKFVSDVISGKHRRKNG